MTDNKTLILTYILYALSIGMDCPVYDIYQFMEAVDGKPSNNEAKARRLRRYIDDLVSIGALVEGTRVRNMDDLETGDSDSAILASSYSNNPKSYSEVPEDLKFISHIDFILRSSCGEDVKHDDTIPEFIESYFTDDFPYNEDNFHVFSSEVEAIREMLEVYEKINESHMNIGRGTYNNAFGLLADIKLEYGFNTPRRWPL